MVIKHFLRWIGNAKVEQRMAAAEALARAYLSNELDFEERCEAEAALTLLLDDLSPRVRHTLSQALSLSHHAPLQIVHALAADQPDVAAPILIRSPLLTDLDLVDRVAEAGEGTRELIASRPLVGMGVSAAIAELGGVASCLRLLQNDGADIAGLSLRRMAERFGDQAAFRESLMKDFRLPADARHLLVSKLGAALSNAPLVRAMMGAERAQKMTQEACLQASITLIDQTHAQEHRALVEHLRMRGELTAGFLVRALACGKVDFLGAALISLTGQGEARIRAVLGGGREAALRAMLTQAGLAEPLHGVILCALRIWREVANGKCVAGTQEVSWAMMGVIGACPGQSGPTREHSELAALLRRIHLEALRSNARHHARVIAAA
jgi:uncharacterized protein (DUF2336 family)